MPSRRVLNAKETRDNQDDDGHAGHKAKIFWTIDNVRWKQALSATLS
jgi:hypothetical protein